MTKLPETMKAVVCYGPEDYRVEEVATPRAGKEEVVIKVGACGICGSDLKAYSGADMYWAGEDPWLKAPVIAGHEFYGVVAELGEGAAEKHNIQIGDRVTTDQINPCGKCMFCETGRYWMCQVHNIYGFQRDVAEGAMAEYMRFGSTNKIYKITDGVTDSEASLIEPAACAVHAVQRATIEFEDVVVMAGAGTLGLCMIQLISLKTPKKLVVLDTNNKRLAMAKKFGADICINPLEEDAVQAVKDLTDGYGCDVYIEATGSPIGVTQGLEMVRKLGRFIEFSVFGQETTTDWSVIGDKKELDLRGSHLSPYTYPIVIDLFERNLLTAEGIITNHFKLEDFHEALAMAKNPEAIKVLLKP
ncbi:alcohol dehydrogenase catalytic domain-containing protein [Halalkalibacter alkaliphilus]|uniref:Alcohol dehydrogenase catalytic domain-containing protein n=1 Tax=Halalkalibacter alkaliphilus TaxID=2917993 RepID=A0A9X1ZY37_9BACI|nr:alcohol dehydrogenase catalytic domain-containing protein [Halalkalibacter alkaliphilus]MCL7746838.1 alcohol dehydrogenase catalytic domain-containing protein [Halalkalibacter alkaliphilus]